MSYETNSLSEDIKEFKTEKMSVPALFFMSEELLPGEETFAQVEDIASILARSVL